MAANEFHLTVGDTGRDLTATLTGADGTPQDLTDTTVRFKMGENKVGGAQVVDAVAIVLDALAGRVRYQWAANDVDTPGEYRGQFIVTRLGRQVSFPSAPKPDEHLRIVIHPAP